MDIGIPQIQASKLFLLKQPSPLSKKKSSIHKHVCLKKTLMYVKMKHVTEQ